MNSGSLASNNKDTRIEIFMWVEGGNTQTQKQVNHKCLRPEQILTYGVK